jgi:hypothetical protein
VNQHDVSILATVKSVAAIDVKCAADLPAASTGGQQFAVISAAVTPF